jgi:hypothetical protein
MRYILKKWLAKSTFVVNEILELVKKINFCVKKKSSSIYFLKIILKKSQKKVLFTV